MPLELVTVPCLSDNYAFVLGDPHTRTAAVVDAPEAGPINAAVAARGWRLTHVLITHHHWDHIDGLPQLDNAANLHLVGAAADAHRLPPLATAVREGDRFALFGSDVHVLEVPGHTVGHIAFHLPGEALAFTGDSLMAIGCGRLFEGSAAQMWDSLQKLRRLPAETLICSGHEYTLSNARFAAHLEPENRRIISMLTKVGQARERGEPTVPTTLTNEMECNPYLRADDPELTAALGMSEDSPLAVFTALRARKDKF